MPRATPRRTPPPELAPRRVEVSLLVLEEFRDPDGTEWRRGDRAPLARRAVREAVMARPELFGIEHETLPVTQADLDGWLAELDAGYKERYEQAKARRDGAEKRRQQALRAELGEQERGQPELERRFKQQERELKERAKRARDEHERRQIENELEFQSGFHVQR